MYSKFISVVYGKISATDRFQFPSNGKVYSKVGIQSVVYDDELLSFNSLQTGKCIARNHSIMLKSVRIGFNSLQTGKCIASLGMAIFQTRLKVSIPFKRESV